MQIGFNQNKQHSIGEIISISGTGLHSGIHADLILKPARPDFGFRFKRTDLSGQPVIKADCDLVSDTFRKTTLSDKGTSVSTVEHILSALVGSGIDNCLIELNGPEVPIVDGSCEKFVHLIEKSGIEEQTADKTWYTLDKEILYHDAEKNITMEAIPSNEYTITTWIDFKNERLKPQQATLKNLRDFKREIAPCRTYCLVHELEMLLEHNLVKGDIVQNAILIIDKPVSNEEMNRLKSKFNIQNFTLKNGGYLNNLELRYENEIARHKLMDLIGDLALIGFPIRANITGYRLGHTSNIDFARKIKKHILKQIEINAMDLSSRI